MKLEIRNGCFGYRKEPLLRDVCMTGREGEITAVLGPNGAGKTTLLRCMLGFLPWRSGKTLLEERDIRTMHGGELWKYVGYVPQMHTSGLALETEEMMLLGRSGSRSLFAQPGQTDRQAVYHWMERLGILHLRGKRCSRISGGELQLVMMGRALVGNPSVLVMDEPESGLDFGNQLRILRLLRELKEEQQLQIIFNTHYPEHGYETADHILLLNKAGESRFGPTDRMISRETLEWAYGVGIFMKKEAVGTDTRICILPFEEDKNGLSPKGGHGLRQEEEKR